MWIGHLAPNGELFLGDEPPHRAQAEMHQLGRFGCGQEPRGKAGIHPNASMRNHRRAVERSGQDRGGAATAISSRALFHSKYRDFKFFLKVYFRMLQEIVCHLMSVIVSWQGRTPCGGDASDWTANPFSKKFTTAG